MPDQNGQQIIKVVRYPRRQPRDRFHALALVQLPFKLSAQRNVPASDLHGSFAMVQNAPGHQFHDAASSLQDWESHFNGHRRIASGSLFQSLLDELFILGPEEFQG